MTSYQNYPLLITRGVHVFPLCFSVLDVGRSFSINAVNLALTSFDGYILVISQTDIRADDKLLDNIYNCGTICHVESFKNDEDGKYILRLLGVSRMKIVSSTYDAEKDIYYATAKVEKSILFQDIDEEKRLLTNLISIVVRSSGQFNIPKPVTYRLQKGMSAEELTDQIANSLKIDVATKQLLLEEKSVKERVLHLTSLLNDISKKPNFEKELDQKVMDRAEENQKEYFLREKLRTIQSELDELNGIDNEGDSLLKRLEKGAYPDNIKEKITKEIKKFNQMPAGSLEASMERTYLDWLLDLPWITKTEDNNSIENARKVLDEDHYGLQKVKDRILEYLAVKTMTNSLKSPILCLYGPPGVGKTSLAKSVARALGRKFVKASLGGTSDESEIRGHRRTYVASMPGKIIKGIKNAGVCNPVFLLDEIDKLTANTHGDPASALLEVLDPEQNALFQDNYIEETFDLSNVLFICTANYLENIPPALRDRLELIELNTYTEEEKMHIAKEHLIDIEIKANGLKNSQIHFEDDAIRLIINSYTREAGVRELQRKIATCCRKAIMELLTKERKRKVNVSKNKVKEFLGVEMFENTEKNKKPAVGVVTGLAYTQFGGDILSIEVTQFEGKGGLVLTGNLGDIMKESATIALDYVKSNAERYKIPADFFMTHDIHVHVPEGAVPKDGPSAGVAITCAIVSSVKNIPCLTSVAMTGEVNLRGQSMPIGGLKEKSLAALRSGIKTILIPEENKKTIQELPQEVKDGLIIKPISFVDQALKEVLESHDFLE